MDEHGAYWCIPSSWVYTGFHLSPIKRISEAQPVPVPNVNRLSPPTIHPATRWVSWTRWRRFRPCHNRLSPWHHRPGRREPWAERRGVAGPATGSGHDPAVAEAKIVYTHALFNGLVQENLRYKHDSMYLFP